MLVRALETEGRLGDRLEEIVQRAQMFREELDPGYDQFDDVQFLKGTGNGSLPDDDRTRRLIHHMSAGGTRLRGRG